MQYKYKVMRSIVNHTIKLQKSILRVDKFRDKENSPVINFFLEQFGPDRSEALVSALDDTIKKAYEILNNPTRFKK